METWKLFWTIILIAACVFYFGVAGFVIVRGARDLKDLFAGGTEQPPSAPPKQPPAPAG